MVKLKILLLLLGSPQIREKVMEAMIFEVLLFINKDPHNESNIKYQIQKYVGDFQTFI